MMKKIVLTLMVTTAIITAQAQTVPVWKLADLQTALDTASRPTIINFWATFCKPCIAELPHFQAAANAYNDKGVKLLLISLDLKEAYPKTVLAFIRSRKLSAPVVFLDETNADKFVPVVDNAWSGAIPATLFINKEKGYRKFVEEELSKKELEEKIRHMLGHY